MNERIKQLILKAGFHPFVRGEQILFDISTEENLKEFAELIVRECAQLVQGVPTDTMGYHTADQKIKQHFGVK